MRYITYSGYFGGRGTGVSDGLDIVIIIVRTGEFNHVLTCVSAVQRNMSVGRPSAYTFWPALRRDGAGREAAGPDTTIASLFLPPPFFG